MKYYAKVIDSSLGLCDVGLGTNENVYKKIGMSIQDVEKGWDGNWYLKGFVPTKPLDTIKEEKLSEINSAYNSVTSALVATYPRTELLTFDKQETEARAWTADRATETPLVDMLAAGRQMDKAELVRRIIAKADAFAVATGYLTGQRQRYEDLLDAATTAEEVEAIVPEYKLPESETTAEKVKLSPYYDL